MTEVLRIKTTAAKEVVDLTDRLEAVIRRTKLQDGLCVLFVTHTEGCHWPRYWGALSPDA